MPATVTTDQIWSQIEKRMFAVLGYVTPRLEARTVGIVYVIRERRFYISTSGNSWKARHIAKNPNVSLTVTVPKRIPFLPWIQIPAATISLQGNARVLPAGEVSQGIQQALLRGLELGEQYQQDICVIEVEPRGQFATYGIGVSMSTMRKPEESLGNAPVKG